MPKFGSTARRPLRDRGWAIRPEQVNMTDQVVLQNLQNRRPNGGRHQCGAD